eukprot:TRINITY_DN8087_c4_g1_i1.p1 TRINITY_DN8087_c4_g1~~TRINITY_DN8087_c4_g1_i1.p1  ORF type:complete len:506 (+),score=18.90 TRINITY_DN8087_c4_g1_i1:36-1520(+)
MATATATPLFFFSIPSHETPVSRGRSFNLNMKPFQFLVNRISLLCAASATKSSLSIELKPLPEVVEALEAIGISERSAKILIRSHPHFVDLSTSSFSATVTALETLEISGDRLVRLIKKHPSLFTLDLISGISSTVSDIPDLDRQKIRRILFVSNPEILVSLQPKISLLTRYDLSKPDISDILNRINLRLFLEKSLEDLDSVLFFLQTLENPKKPSVNHPPYCLIVRHPSLLLLDLETDLRPTVAFFRRFLSDPGALHKLLWRFPIKRWFTVDNLQFHVDFLATVGFSGSDIRAILWSYPQIFTLHIDRKIKPKLEFLRKCGLEDDQIVKILTAQPSFLGLSFDGNVYKKAEYLTALGFRPYSLSFARVLSTVTRIAYGELTKMVGMLMGYGLSGGDICRMCEKQPHVLKYTCRCLEPKVEYLVRVMDCDVGVLVDFPTCLGYSLENRIRPRHEAMTWLVAKGLAKEDYSINRMLSLSNREFARLTARSGYCED